MLGQHQLELSLSTEEAPAVPGSGEYIQGGSEGRGELGRGREDGPTRGGWNLQRPHCWVRCPMSGWIAQPSSTNRQSRLE